MTRPSLIPRNRLAAIPSEVRLAHELCFFLHDEAVRMLVEYEAMKADVVTFDFRDRDEMERFNAAVADDDPIGALREIGRLDEARRVVINRITFALTSDLLHHVYEALRCMEKRKFIVALNLLRKPLHDNLLFLAWMLGDEDGFYEAFTKHGPQKFISSHLGNRRLEILREAISRTEVSRFLTAETINDAIWNHCNKAGLYRLFQHAVHLVTVSRPELATEPEKFNFVFKSHADDDIYHGLYDHLPALLLFALHVIRGLFDRMRPMDAGATTGLTIRSVLAWMIVLGGEAERDTIDTLNQVIAPQYNCEVCDAIGSFTRHNAAGILMCERYRCNRCRQESAFPFSWLAAEF